MLGRGAVLAGALVLIAIVFTAWQALHVRSALQGAAASLTSMTTSLADGNLAAAERQVRAAGDDAAQARRHTRGPVWWMSSKLPWLGDDVTAVRTVAEVTDALAGDTLPPLLRAGSTLTDEALTPRGSIALEPIAAAAPGLETGARQVAGAAGRIDALETEGLLWLIEPQVRDLRDKLMRARDLTSAASTAADLLPPMLGQDRERTYLLEFQNNAEVRATGGLPGAFAIVSVTDGELELVRTGAPRDVPYFDAPFREQSPEEEALFTSRAVQYSQDTGINPHFPWSAETLGQMWSARQGTKIDGVMAIDPVAFSYALGATGPLTVAGKQLTPANAVDLLLRDVYIEEPDDEAQNRFYANVTRAFFARISRGDFDPGVIVAALSRGVEERRVMLWSENESEQAVLAPLRISGAVPDEPGRHPEIGLYLNDSGSDKLTYYLDHTVDVTPRSCGSLGNQVLDVKVTLASTVPVGVAFPPSVVGTGTPGVAKGDMLITTYLYAPAGGRIDALRVDGEETAFFEGSHRDREVGALSLLIPREQKQVMEYTVYSGRGQTGKPRVMTTPGVRSTGVGKIGGSAC